MPVGPVAKVDAYLARLPDDQRKALTKLRAQIRGAAPGGEEGMGYGLPGFYLDGPLVYYGAMKGHCGIYGKVPSEPADLVCDLAPYATGKGTLRFLPEAPIPATLVRRLVKARLAENKARVSRKAGKTNKAGLRKAAPKTAKRAAPRKAEAGPSRPGPAQR